MKTKTSPAGKIDPRVPLLGAVLVLALLGVALSWRLNQSASSTTPNGSPMPTTVEQMSKETDRLLSVVQTRLSEDAQSIEADWPVAESLPVAPQAQALQAPEMTFRLRGVVRGGERPAAFLNDRTLLLGEELDGSKLVEIAEDHVVLVGAKGRRYELFLESEK